MKTTLGYSEIFVILMGVYLTALIIYSRVMMRSIRIQQLRYPIFECRDAIVRLHLEYKFPEPVFQRLMALANSMLIVTHHIDLFHLVRGMSAASRTLENDQVTEELIRIIKTNPELRKQLNKLMNYFMHLVLRNSSKRILEIIKLLFTHRSTIKNGMVSYRIIKDFSQNKLKMA